MGNKISYIFRRLIERLSGLKSVFSGNWVKPAVILSACVIFIAGSFVIWTNVLSPEARKSREDGEKIAEFFSGLQAAEERQRQDIYGGETPEETLQLFIAALEKDDLELASKYFKLTVQGEEDSVWINTLQDSRLKGMIDKSINLIKSAKFTGESMPGYAGFDVIGDDGLVLYGIDLVRNQYSNLWKIESM